MLVNEQSEAEAPPREASQHIPGEAGVWVFIFGEMVAFAVLFVNYLHYRAAEPELFATAQQTLKQSTGAFITVLLLSSSLLVVLALRAIRQGLPALAQRLIAGAMAGGVAFAVLKVLEYHDKLDHGHTPATNDFYMQYFVLTGLHFFHLIVGLIVLFVMLRFAGKPEVTSKRLIFLEAGASYWHMVDLLWIVIYPLLYVVR